MGATPTGVWRPDHPAAASEPYPAAGPGRALPFPRIARALERIPAEYALALAALAVALALFFFGERVQVGGGLGWDGVIYAEITRNFRQDVFVKGLDGYYVQRTLLPGVVHYSLRVLNISLSDRNIIRAFGLLSVLLLTLTGYVWGLISRELKVSRAGQWFGFAALFFNYAILKQAFYTPVTTDVFAFALGVFMVFGYLARRTSLLYALTFAGAFVWPLAAPVGVLLLLFPRRGDKDFHGPPVWKRWDLAAAGLVTLVALVGICYAARKGPALLAARIEPVYVEPIHSVLILSVAISIAYLFAGLGPLLRCPRLYDWRHYWYGCRTFAWLGAPALFAGILAVQALLSHGKPTCFTLKEMLAFTALTSVAKPGIFLVTHVAYYGPIFLLAMFLWRPVCRLLHEHGTGLTLAVLLGLLLSLNSQSRYFINIITMVVPFVVKATDSLRWRPRRYGLVCLLCVLSSKVWLTMNGRPFTGRLLEFPDQYMFMSTGPWVSNAMYLAQGGAFLAMGFALYAICFGKALPLAQGEAETTINRAA